ncbi:glucan biosynthesis protein [Colwellia echini]|uniref:glucan biosynthesis protein n=1 Tax=Colwellia echini TaxID=1982103 RepID=UPI00147948FA|nr:glucan biosynthesis protein [Colwellia echini]
MKKLINQLAIIATLVITPSYNVLAQTDASDTQEAKQVQERPTYNFDREWLENKAKELASKDYQSQRIPENNPLSTMSYDEYKKIQFERGATIWSREDRNFRLIPLHPGFLFKTPVKLNLVVNDVSRRVLYTTDIFNYDDELQNIKKSAAEGYSGFSVTHPINTAKKWDEFMVFQGGTYFRAVGETNWYGLSARGLAINTAKPSGEEFPEFTEFWIERPSKDNEYLIVHALMQSPSATGAFTFTASPGKNTEIKVESAIFPRKDIPSFGIAPLTSMFLFNPINTTQFDDFRPAVHDSEGLFIVKGNGEHIWRPLANPRRLEISMFEDDAIKGFGLMQRSRKFSHFEDIEAHYHKRPSAWVTPISDWGEGHVELIEIPTNAEIHDNIVAFWQPKKPLKAGQTHRFAYKVAWGSSVPTELQEGRIVDTASGNAFGSTTVRDFVIDYEGKSIPDNMIINASSSTGKIVGTISKVIPENGNLRVVVKFEPADEDFSELRVSLTNKDKQWGETWLYRWTR